MTRSATVWTFGLLLSLATVPVSAQELVTLESAIQEALARNASLRAVRAGAAEAAEHVGEARAGWLPRISFTESWQRGDQPVFVFSSLLSSRNFTAANFAIDALNNPDPIGFFRSSIGAEQLLFDGGRQRSLIKSAQLRSEMSALAVNEATGSLVSAATQTYGRILIADAGARAAHAAVESAEEDASRAARRRDAGLATEGDVLALAAQVAALRQREIDHQADAAVARAELNRLTGSPIDRTFQVSEPPIGINLSEISLGAALSEADANRPELKRAEAEIRLAESERQGVRTSLIPQVAAQAGLDMNGIRFADREPSWIVGGELRWNFSLGGAELARARAASQAQIRAAAEAEDLRANVRLEVVTAFRRLEAARARQAVGLTAVNQARERQRIVRDRFDAGMAGITDVLQASGALTDAEAQRVAAVVDAITSETSLRRAIGRHP